jgi:hypothetical protein
MEDFIAFLSSWPVYELIIFTAGIGVGYAVAHWRQQQRKRERHKRNMQAHARRVASGGRVGRGGHDDPA